ncbi:MAG: hypothetical protein FWG65_08870 [Turicibacter sp.]|nr:hypothetical protein [Turicibacter sp.]
MKKLTKGLVSGALALILTLGVGGFTVFAGEVDMGAFAGGNPSFCSGGGGSSEEIPPRPVPGWPDFPVPEV